MQNDAGEGKETTVAQGSQEKYESLPCAIKNRFIN